MTTDFTTTPATERELTIQELLLIKHMETISYAQRLEKKVAFLEERLSKLENEIEEITNHDVWTVLNDATAISDKFFS